ncbi:MAG: hypothetical protein GF334_01515 [Candidatus Altiarchaeales archaeon]|nr:hypothetical protein [Candidatus Altiarchaeales archaeon]
MPKKNNKPSKSVNIDAIKRDASKLGKQLSKENPASFGKELSPGSVRRESPLEQEIGSTKYREMIHQHNKKNEHILDRLPFTFPKKKVVRSHLNVVVECVECGHQAVANENTVGITCPECKDYCRVINPEREKRYGDESDKVGIFGTASDLLELREKRRASEDNGKKEQ